MREVTLEELLEAGCHFGHQVTRQNPKARDFVFEARDNIHIIDLGKTKEGLEAAGAFVKNLATNGKNMIIVATKRQAKAIVEEEVRKAQEMGTGKGLFLVTNRWIGGMLTNFGEIAKNVKRLKEITARLGNDEEKVGYTKKEVGLWEKERIKLLSFYGGIAEMDGIPGALFIIDTHLEDLAVREAKAMGVTMVGIVDTNADPTFIDYPIPANDDAVGSIKLITSYIIDEWIEGRKIQEAGIKNQELGEKTTSTSNAAAAKGETKVEKVEKKKVSKETKEPKETKAKKKKEAKV